MEKIRLKKMPKYYWEIYIHDTEKFVTTNDYNIVKIFVQDSEGKITVEKHEC